MTPLTDLALRAYPPSFRARYGPELAALVEDLPTSPKRTADLFLGAARAWIRPPFGGVERRLRASMATTWVAWCAGFLVAPAINRALLDPPTGGVTGGVRALLNIAYVLFFVGWAAVLLGAAPVVLRTVLPALRTRSWPALRPLFPATVLGVVEVIGLLWLAPASGGHSGQSSQQSGLFLAGTVLWLIGLVAFVCSLGIGPAVTLTRSEPPAPALRLPVRLAALVAVVLTALTGCSLAATVVAGGGTLVSSAIPVACVLAAGCLASLTALISSSRGVRALRST